MVSDPSWFVHGSRKWYADVTFIPWMRGCVHSGGFLTTSGLPPPFHRFRVRENPAYEVHAARIPCYRHGRNSSSISSSNSSSKSRDPPLPLCTMSQMLESVTAVRCKRKVAGATQNVDRISGYNHNRSSQRNSDDISLNGFAGDPIRWGSGRNIGRRNVRC
jgi:hypothetical protein